MLRKVYKPKEQYTSSFQSVSATTEQIDLILRKKSRVTPLQIDRVINLDKNSFENLLDYYLPYDEDLRDKEK